MYNVREHSRYSRIAVMTQTDKSDGPSVSKVLTYWFGSDPESIDLMKAQKKVWYRGGSKVDQQIKEEFGTTIEALEMGRLLEWGETAKGGLALVIVLDQFSRHVYRGTREAFAQDPLARAIARRLVGRRLDTHLSVPQRAFLYHPFKHSESPVDQKCSLDLFLGLHKSSPQIWRGYTEDYLDNARLHSSLIDRFGRFPHRNAVLGRESTPEESTFLESSSRFGQ